MAHRAAALAAAVLAAAALWPFTASTSTTAAAKKEEEGRRAGRALAVNSPFTLNAFGRRWFVKDSGGKPALPGPCIWSASPSRVYADGAGLHLTVAPEGPSCSNYRSTEAWLTQPLGYGTYLFQISGPFVSLDPEVTFGLFLWDDDCPGSCHFREIDFEIAKWGNDGDVNHGQWVVQPWGVQGNLKRFSLSRARSLGGQYGPAGGGGCAEWGHDGFGGAQWQQLTLVLQWYAGGLLRFFIFDGHRKMGELRSSASSLLASWEYPHPERVPRPGDERVRLNLWQANWGGVPRRNRRVHVVVNAFEHQKGWIDLPAAGVAAPRTLSTAAATGGSSSNSSSSSSSGGLPSVSTSASAADAAAAAAAASGVGGGEGQGGPRGLEDESPAPTETAERLRPTPRPEAVPPPGAIKDTSARHFILGDWETALKFYTPAGAGTEGEAGAAVGADAAPPAAPGPARRAQAQQTQPQTQTPTPTTAAAPEGGAAGAVVDVGDVENGDTIVIRPGPAPGGPPAATGSSPLGAPSAAPGPAPTPAAGEGDGDAAGDVANESDLGAPARPLPTSSGASEDDDASKAARGMTLGLAVLGAALVAAGVAAAALGARRIMRRGAGRGPILAGGSSSSSSSSSGGGGSGGGAEADGGPRSTLRRTGPGGSGGAAMMEGSAESGDTSAYASWREPWSAATPDFRGEGGGGGGASGGVATGLAGGGTSGGAAAGGEDSAHASGTSPHRTVARHRASSAGYIPGPAASAGGAGGGAGAGGAGGHEEEGPAAAVAHGHHIRHPHPPGAGQS